MANHCVDYNQELIDFTEEDDYLIAFHSLEDARVSGVFINRPNRRNVAGLTCIRSNRSNIVILRFGTWNQPCKLDQTDNETRRRRSLLRKSLGWDSAFFTSAGLLSPEELVMINKGFKKSNATTQKDAKRSTKIGAAFKKMNICTQNKDKVTSFPKLFSSRQTNNNAAVGRSDSGDKIIDKTRKAQDFKTSSTCFTSPAVQRTVHHTYKSPYSAKRSTKIVGCYSFKNTNTCSQNKKQDKVTRLPKNNAAVERSDNGVIIKNKTRKAQDSKTSPSDGLPKLTCFTSPTLQKTVHHSYESSSSKNLSKFTKGKVNPKNMKLVCSPTSVFHFPSSPSSTSPSSTFSHQSCEERRSISQNATIGSGGHMPKEILNNRMMSLDQNMLKDDCGSFQAEKQNVHSFKDEVNDQRGQLEVINLERVAVEVRGQQMHSCFKDDNLQLIDCCKEDDCLIPFPYCDFLEDLRLSAAFDNVHENVQSERRRQSLLRKSLAWDNAFFTSAGLLNPEELFVINKGFKKSNPTTPKDATRSKVATKIGGNQSNELACKKMNNAAAVKGSDNAKMENITITARRSKRSRSGGLPKLTCFTSPTIQKTVHHSHGPSFKHLSKSVKKKVSPKNMKSVNSPSSVLHFLLSSSSTSPASSIDGGSLSSTPVTLQNAIPVLDFKSQDSEERKFVGQKAVKASGLRMPSPRIGFFDMEPGNMHNRFRCIESQFQSSNLSHCVSAENCKKVGKFPSTGNSDRLKHNAPGRYQEYPLHYSRTALAGKMLSFDAELYD